MTDGAIIESSSKVMGGKRVERALVRICVPPLLNRAFLNQIARLTAHPRLRHMCLRAPEAEDAGRRHPAPESQRHQQFFLCEAFGEERPVVAPTFPRPQ